MLADELHNPSRLSGGLKVEAELLSKKDDPLQNQCSFVIKLTVLKIRSVLRSQKKVHEGKSQHSRRN